ncbi:SLATT domain-containing protein [Pigmentibacter ruber]|uniref:SLATT domain-containing protein n=1 Tax=Pigmentibacter ruber TaxID=2683196 RepID=UPI00131A70A5|nr:SLATT domain-containing protein [Pigmentibacter ruber]
MENNNKKENVQELEKNIVITKNSRMKAEVRLKFYSFWLNTGVAISSIIIVIINVIILVFPDYDRKHILTFVSLFYSLLILISSLLIWSRNFEIRANNFKDCYLRLDKLLRELKSTNDEIKIGKKYDSILKKFENHETVDYIDAMLEFNIKQKKDQSSYKKMRLITLNEKIKHYFFKIIRILFYILIVIAPLIFSYYLIFCIKS